MDRGIAAIQKKVIYSDDVTASGSALHIGDLPANAYITSIYAIVKTVNNDSTSASITVGTSADPDAVETGIDVKAAAGKVAGTPEAAYNGVVSTTEPTRLYATLTGGAGDGSAGEAHIVIEYKFDE